MNDMRKLMEMVGRADDEVAYIAAKLYLKGEANKPSLTRKLSELANVDASTAMLMIDAIDAYEDLREAPEAWALDEDRNAPHEMNPREYAAFIYGVEWGNSAQYSDGGYQAYELPVAYKDWIEGGRKGYYDD